MAPIPGWQNLIVCDGVEDPCTYESLFELARALITDLVILSTFLAVAVFAIAGMKLMFSGGDVSALSDAKRMFWSMLKGFLWILFAWVIVYTITSVLLKDGWSLLSK